MNRPFCSSNKMLERKWRDMAYQRHRDKLKKIKPEIRQEFNKNKEEENYKMQRRTTRVLAEGRRKEILAQENQKIFVTIFNIMARPSQLDTWNKSYSHPRRKRPNKVPPLEKVHRKEKPKEKGKTLVGELPQETDELPKDKETSEELSGEEEEESTIKSPEVEETEGLPEEEAKEETDKLPEETDKLPEETDKLPEETDKLPEESDKLPEETDKLPEKEVTPELPEGEVKESTVDSSETKELAEESPEEKETEQLPEEAEQLPEEIEQLPDETEQLPRRNRSLPEEKATIEPPEEKVK